MARPALPQKLNVCLIARRFPISGRATGFSFLRLIARGMAARGHQVTVLASEHPQGRLELDQDGVKIYFLQESRAARVRRDPFPDLVAAKFVDLHRKQPFHLVHSVDNSAVKISRYKEAYRVAIAYDVAATRMSELFSLLGMSQETLGSLISTSFAVGYKFLSTYYGGDRQLLSRADGIFVASPRERITLERYYLYPDARVHTVPYGIEIGDLGPRERSDELRKKLEIPESAKVAVTITDMTEVGEVVNLLRAFEQVVIKRPSSRLIVVGTGPKFKDIEREMLNLALGSRVVLTGAIKDTDIPDYIALADVFVNLSSRTTGFEPSLLEAMAQKKVIIGSEVSPMGTIVEHSRDGFLIRPADVAELTTLLLDVFAGHLPAAEIGEAARMKVLDLFDPEKMVIETLTAYYAILKSTGYYQLPGTFFQRLLAERT
jgi:glycosyltransferase involved in cell wall biosynthesis